MRIRLKIVMRQAVRHDESDRTVFKHMRPRVECRIHFAGSLVGFGEPLLDAVRAELSRRAFAPVVAETEIGFVTAGADIVLRGASVLVLSREMRLL